MKNFLYILVLTSLVASCSSDDKLPTAGANTITANDFESVAGWGVDPETLTKEHAHSGKYALKVDAGHEYSLTYDVVLGQASPRKLKKVRLTGWAFLPNDKATSVLSLQIIDPDQGNKGVFVDGIDLRESVKDYNKWVKVSKEFTLPEDITYTQHMKIFLWRAGSSEPSYLDDIVVETIE